MLKNRLQKSSGEGFASTIVDFSIMFWSFVWRSITMSAPVLVRLSLSHASEIAVIAVSRSMTFCASAFSKYARNGILTFAVVPTFSSHRRISGWNTTTIATRPHCRKKF